MQSLPWHPTLRVLDSHTGGEPTRVILDSGLPLEPGAPDAVRQQLANRFDLFRQAVIQEPRGNDVLVGALVLPPTRPDTVAGVVFFNNVGYLGMCGHGLIGLMVTLHQEGQIGPGVHRVETPVGTVEAELLDAAHVRVTNVPSYLWQADVSIPGSNTNVAGDIAWGGNWFFLVQDHQQELELSRWRELGATCQAIRMMLEAADITGADGQLIDHIELFGPGSPGTQSRNFVLCPGFAYDRSPCGTGCSAKIACLAARGQLAPGQTWVQESITGSRFELSYQPGPIIQREGQSRSSVLPSITGSAYLCGESRLHFHPQDPFQLGICS